MYGSVRGAISDGRPYRDSNCPALINPDFIRSSSFSRVTTNPY
jgi:hypothetical protein